MGKWKIEIDGVFKDFADDLKFRVSFTSGTGMLNAENPMHDLSIQDGALDPQKIKFIPRGWALNGSLNAGEGDESQTNFHSRKKALLKALNARASQKIGDPLTPLKIKYTGATDDKNIFAYYDGGLNDGPDSERNGPFTQRGQLRFISPNPFFYATAESSESIDVNNSATFRLVARRNGDASVPIWDSLGPPNVAGTYFAMNSIANDDTYIYFGGQFDNFDNIANADNIVRMNKLTDVFSALSTGANSTVWAMAIAPNGDLYAGGAFGTIGGVAASNIGKWDGSVWTALGSGLNGIVEDIIIDSNGDLIVAGQFTTAGGSSANRIAKWDVSASSWSTLGTGFNNVVRKVLFDGNGNLYAGGAFTTADGNPVNRLSIWDGSTWEVAGEPDNSVEALTIDNAGDIYAGGAFTTIGGVSASRIAKFNGSVWSPLASGASGTIFDLFEVNGLIYAGGGFNTIGEIDARNLGIWNGSVWVSADIAFAVAKTVRAVRLDNDNIYIGSTSSVAQNFSGHKTIAYSGSAKAYPYFTIKRVGGTSAKLLSMHNETTNAILYFNYDLLDGETITIDLRPDSIGVTSDFKGNIPNAILPNSDTGQFYLTGGNGSGNNDNVITAFVDEVGSPTMTANIFYTVAYLSQD